MIISIVLCLAAFVALVLIVRNHSPSLGLPVAYLFVLLLNHLPGAVAHAMPWERLLFTNYVAIGIRLTAIGALCFAVGVWLARRKGVPKVEEALRPGSTFPLFCLVGGWIATFGFYPILVRIPSLGSIMDNGCKLWMIAVMVALPVCVFRRQVPAVMFWLGTMMVFTLWKLMWGGFLGAGVVAALICVAPLAVLTARAWKVWLAIPVLVFLGMSVFVSYFLIRTDIRKEIWAESGFERRWNASTRIIREFQWIDLRKSEHLKALDARLNQNYFLGLSATRLGAGVVDYRKGQTLVDGVLMLIPRAIWANKPLKGGSGRIVAEMSGLQLSKSSSFGVGNVMEFYINFGMASLVLGFVGLGFALGKLDYLSACALQEANYTRAITMILTTIALTQPESSFIEQVGGAAGAIVAGQFWCFLWMSVGEKRKRRVR